MLRYAKSLAVAASFAFVCAAAPAFADSTLLTDNTGYTGPGLDLSAYANGQYNFTFGPTQVSGFTFTAAPGNGGNSGMGSVIGQGSYGLAGNGSFGGDATYIGVDSATGSDRLLGTRGYSEIGFYMNYAPGVGDDPTISTLDASGNILATFDLAQQAPISTPGGFNQFEFRGVSSTDAGSIYGLQFGGSYLLLTGTANGVVTPPAVPETATWAMMIGGLGLVGAAMRRAYRKSQDDFTRAVKSLAAA